MTEAYEDLKRKVAKKVKLIQKHKEELNKLYAKCTHEETYKKEWHFEACGYEESYTTVDTKCMVCHKTSESTDRVSPYR